MTEAEAGSNLEAGAAVEVIPHYQHIPNGFPIPTIRIFIDFQTIKQISLSLTVFHIDWGMGDCEERLGSGQSGSPTAMAVGKWVGEPD